MARAFQSVLLWCACACVFVEDDGRVAFLDWGIVGTLPASVWASAAAMRAGFASGDMRAVNAQSWAALTHAYAKSGAGKG
jgi:hypothetical protein